ncbi:hypothetical protein DYD21_18860 [Rhodohalobacter sp. SW132]|uniref:hypothetical protein n=1 Tax=Rhodohalobacter sp. SW132 TaxID=2293433 RepID=UPI000E27BA48|nr:hypothetical protein [Rhodohalobacter sp. SW132]REL24271.1 hypothetical protein DYD21_18860 [Rhodohalobacter sp. SW132]
MKTLSTLSQISALLLFLLFFIFSESVYSQDNDRRPVLHELVVKVVGDEWRVVYINDETKSTVTAKRNDRISWSAEGSDISLQFDGQLFGGNSYTIGDGNSLMRPVAPGAAHGEYIYAVFIHSDLVFARGESPPRIIVER